MYIGNDLQVAESGNKIIDDISSSFNGSTTSFALLVGGAAPVPFPINTQQIYISVNGVIQEPDPTGSAGFKLLGNNIVFSSAPANGHAFFGVILSGADYVTVGTEFPAGSATSPSITFGPDNDTGLYSVTGGTMGFTSDGVQTFTLDGDGFKLPDNKKLFLGSSSDLELFHNATNSHIRNQTGDLIIDSNSAGAVRLRPKVGEEGVVAITDGAVSLYHDGTKKFETTATGTNVTGIHVDDGATHDGDVTFTGAAANVVWDKSVDDLIFNDNAKAAFGTSSDLLIWHNGTHSYIKDAGTGKLRILSNEIVLGNESDDENLATFTADGACILYHNGSARLETYASGIIVSGGRITGSDGSDLTFQLGTGHAQIFRTNDVERMRITAAGLVGIGCTPDSGNMLHIEKNGEANMTLEGNVNGIGGYLMLRNNDTTANASMAIQFIDGGGQGTSEIKGVNVDNANNEGALVLSTRPSGGSMTEGVRLDSSGRLMIGTTTEGHADTDDLTIAGSAHTGITIRSGVNHSGSIYFSDATSGAGEYKGYIQYDQQNDNLRLGCDSDTVLWLHADKKLSLGEDSAAYGQWFFSNRGSSGGDATGGDTGMTIYSDTGFTNNTVLSNSDWTLKLANGSYAGTGVSGSQGTVVKILFNGATSNGWNAYGAIGLDVQGTSGNKGDLFFNTGGTTDGNERMRIRYDGKVMIATTTAGHANADDLTIGPTTAGARGGLTINAANDLDCSIHFGDSDSDTSGQINYDHNGDYMSLYTGNAKRLRIDSDGIKFGTSATASDALDDYEEGTWTPAVTFGGGNTGQTYNSNTGGSYTKIGRFVHIHGRIQFSGKGTSTGHAYITGLPFTPSNSASGASSLEGGIYFAYQNNVMASEDRASMLGYIVVGVTTIELYFRNDSGDLNQITDSDFESTTSLSFEGQYPA